MGKVSQRRRTKIVIIKTPQSLAKLTDFTVIMSWFVSETLSEAAAFIHMAI